MKQVRQVLASLVGAAIVLSSGLTTPAHADPHTEPPGAAPADIDTPTATNTRRVLVMLRKQPSGKGMEAEGIAAVDRVLDRWSEQPGFNVRRKFGTLVNAFSAEIPENLLVPLALDPDVASVKPLKVFQPVMATAGEASGSVTARQNLGVDGSGTLVSVIDSGVDPTHQDMRLDDGADKKMEPQSDKYTDKIPYGWNYADGNAEFFDRTTDQHGMHVAGIVGANGGKAANEPGSGRILGIAPNAQLLSMKVFSNDPHRSGAQEDDIIAAIEDSVELGADVINLSLGIPNGTAEATIGEGRAIANALAAGVEVVVAAGNEGINLATDAETKDQSELLDDGTLHTPASTSDALAIASINNSHVPNPMAIATAGGEKLRFGYQVQTGQPDQAEHTLVSGGYGLADDIPDTARDNYVLIARGRTSFGTMFRNAAAKGARGVFVFNTAERGDVFDLMGGIPDTNLVGVFLLHSDGQRLQQKIEAHGGSARIQLTDHLISVPNPEGALEPSLFTSWGSTPSLDFKPQLAGIGGDVYSTLNSNRYGTKSGTSMAAPHVAGAFALGLQEYRRRFPEMSASERRELLRVGFANTAQILQHDDAPFAPRQIGAGLIHTEEALTTKVFATVDGAPHVALRQVTGTTNFDVTLSNLGDEELRFNPGATCVLAESQQAGSPNETSCSADDELRAPQGPLVVPAGGTATATFTLDADASKNHWVQGWVVFESTDPAQPDLSLPYLGFAGDWNAEPIIDPAPESGQESYLDRVIGPRPRSRTQLLGAAGEGGVTPTQWFSPNGDGSSDTILPQLQLLRSAGEVRYEIVHGDDVVRALGIDRNLLRHSRNSLLSLGADASHVAADRKWDGGLYDPADDQFHTIDDAPLGEYRYRIRARLSDEFDWQVTELELGVDTVAPTVATASVTPKPDGGISYTFHASDALSGVNPHELKATDTRTRRRLQVVPGADSTYRVDVPADLAKENSYLALTVGDRAGNHIVAHEFYVTRDLNLLETNLDRWVGTLTEERDRPTIEDGQLVLRMKVRPNVAAVQVNETSVTPEDGFAIARLPLSEGRNEISITAREASGTTVATANHWLGYDITPPTIQITKINLNDKGEVILDENGQFNVEGKISDEHSPADRLVVLDQFRRPHPVAPDGTFTMSYAPSFISNIAQVFGFDHWVSEHDRANGRALAWVIAGREAPKPGYGIIFDDPKLNAPTSFYGNHLNLVDSSFKNLTTLDDEATGSDAAARLTLKGVMRRLPTKLVIDGKPVALDETGRFSVDIELVNGITKVPFEVLDESDTPFLKSAWRFLYDRRMPGIDLTVNPPIAANGAIFLSQAEQTVSLNGTVWDNEFGYQLAVNGSVVQEFENLWDQAPDLNKRPFEAEVRGARDGHSLRISLFDGMANGFEQGVPLILDDKSPEVRFGAPKPVLSAKDSVTVTASDDYLQSLQVLVDGKPVASEMVAVRTHPKAWLTTFRDGEPAPAGAAGAGDAQQQLTLDVRLSDVPGLSSGMHTLVAISQDLGGRTTVESLLLRVDEPPVIEGPDSLDLLPDADARALIGAAYSAKDPEDGQVEVRFELPSVLSATPTPVVLTATDSAGNVTKRTVQVRLVGAPTGDTPPVVTPTPPADTPPVITPTPPADTKPTAPAPGKRPGLPKTGR